MTAHDHDSMAQSILKDYPSLKKRQMEHLDTCVECVLALIEHRDRSQNCDDKLELDDEAKAILERSRRNLETRFTSSAKRKSDSEPAKISKLRHRAKVGAAS